MKENNTPQCQVMAYFTADLIPSEMSTKRHLIIILIFPDLALPINFNCIPLLLGHMRLAQKADYTMSSLSFPRKSEE